MKERSNDTEHHICTSVYALALMIAALDAHHGMDEPYSSRHKDSTEATAQYEKRSLEEDV